MAGAAGFRGNDKYVPGLSYSQLLPVDDNVVGLDHANRRLSYSPSSLASHEKFSKMLCFGKYQRENEGMLFVETPQEVHLACSGSSPASSGNRKRAGSSQQLGQCMRTVAGAAQVAGQKSGKKGKGRNTNPAASSRNTKVKKEKLGERITALQHLVSPFGKTDAASVLHEAMGYIRFLHDQIEVLCSPYLQRLPNSALTGSGEKEGDRMTRSRDLKSIGLCLVPVACAMHVDNSNVADFWLPAMAMAGNVSWSTTSTHH